MVAIARGPAATEIASGLKNERSDGANRYVAVHCSE
jgi:hypothetical protein